MSKHAIKLAEVSLTADRAQSRAALRRRSLRRSPRVRGLSQRVEALVRCVSCGRSTLVGDLAVVFHNRPPLSDSFVAELGAVMGLRTRMVVERL